MVGLLTTQIAWQQYSVNHQCTIVPLGHAQIVLEQVHCRKSLKLSWRTMVQYNQWINTDRANLETRIAPVEEFLEVFIAALDRLKLHDFIAKNQARFIVEKNERLTLGEFIVIADFSENYSFVVQD